ncbi:DNA-binding protein [Roseospira navarrensis]|uniref:HTH Mu-type domain-containing protein n=1 Tax=Roseospira navarrensis TaxID=140058 RepID=A0A7X1ZHH9_9PROT|nr:DNA-binding protein [Roseospira navarrensis]MQX38609.1 hypothetical protein [Roseospira navarrensis]
MSTTDLPLTVQVPAEDWATARRRIAFLEAVIVQILRDKARLREWFSAAELAALRLPGLPGSATGIASVARARGWPRRSATAPDRARLEYHVYALPGRAFDALLDRIVKAPPCVDDPAPHRPETPAPSQVPGSAVNTAPSWVLPLMRLVKSGTARSLDDLVRDLPAALPVGTAAPSRAEIMEALAALGVRCL